MLGRSRLDGPARADALDASPLSLQRDFWRGMGRRGDHAIHGKRGHIYSDADGYLLYVRGHSARQWSAAKRKFSLCQLRIDGDDEGTCTLIIYRHRQRPRQSARSWAFGSVEGHLQKLHLVWPIVTPPIFRGFSAAHSFFRLARSKVAIAHFARI